MPIYEFKCLRCNEYFELLLMKSDEKIEMKCPGCRSGEVERVISHTSFNMGGGSSGENRNAASQTRTCSGGTCTTYDIPGPSK